VHAVAVRHDTAANPVPVDRPGPGMAWARQVVPFHRSASPTVMLLPPLLRELTVTAPTAVQAPGAAQDTARK